jgi:hypothetical protein
MDELTRAFAAAKERGAIAAARAAAAQAQADAANLVEAEQYAAEFGKRAAQQLDNASIRDGYEYRVDISCGIDQKHVLPCLHRLYPSFTFRYEVKRETWYGDLITTHTKSCSIEFDEAVRSNDEKST